MLNFYKKTKNFLHVHVLMKIYALLYKLDKSRSIWMYYSINDLYTKSSIIKSKLDLNKNPKILELGCGTGILLKPFSCNNNELHGVDINKLNIDTLKLEYPDGNFYNSDCVDFMNKTDLNFDLIIIHGVLGFFTTDVQIKLIEKSLSRLNMGGYLWLGAVQFENSSKPFQTYLMPPSLINNILKDRKDITETIFNEHQLFGILKYCKDQISILLHKNKS